MEDGREAVQHARTVATLSGHCTSSPNGEFNNRRTPFRVLQPLADATHAHPAPTSVT
jgi:hypothetical protein